MFPQATSPGSIWTVSRSHQTSSFLKTLSCTVCSHAAARALPPKPGTPRDRRLRIPSRTVLDDVKDPAADPRGGEAAIPATGRRTGPRLAARPQTWPSVSGCPPRRRARWPPAASGALIYSRPPGRASAFFRPRGSPSAAARCRLSEAPPQAPGNRLAAGAVQHGKGHGRATEGPRKGWTGWPGRPRLANPEADWKASGAIPKVPRVAFPAELRPVGAPGRRHPLACRSARGCQGQG